MIRNRKVSKLLSFAKFKFIFVALVSIVITSFEALFLFNLKYTYEFFISLLENQIVVIGLLLSGYSIIILLNLLLIFICRYWAFIESYNFCMFQLLSTKYTKSLIRNAEGVNRILAIERHRLAAQVLGPLFAILQKSFLPVGVGAYFIFYYPNLAIALIPIFIIAFLIFYISSSLFRKFANKLELGLKKYSEYVFGLQKMFDIETIRTTHEREVKLSKKPNHLISMTEGMIDFVSQLPRQVLDLMFFSIIVFTMLGQNGIVAGLETILLASPIYLRAVSNIQYVYKDYASIYSNLPALSVFNLQEKILDIKFQSHETQINLEANNNLKVDGNLVATNCKTIALLADSGLGKTNAILNFIHHDLDLPSRIKIHTINKNQKKIGFISSDPYFREIPEFSGNRNFLNFFNESLLCENMDNSTCSQGELFRWNLYCEMSANPDILFIDESIIHVEENLQNKIIDFFNKSEVPTLLFIITHSKSLTNKCSYAISNI